jgi:hypothetical protein
MVISIHLAALGPLAAVRCLRGTPQAGLVPGLRFAETAIAAPLGAEMLPRPSLGEVGLIAAWANDTALDAFLATHPVARLFEGGYQVRLSPLRVVGSWPELGELELGEDPTAGGGPVAGLTLGRLKLHRAVPFLRASSRAEAASVMNPAMLLSTGLARPPRLVATFSIWRDLPALRDFAAGAGGGHAAAVQAHDANPFHSASAFIRFRPYAEFGQWDRRGSPASQALP